MLLYKAQPVGFIDDKFTSRLVSRTEKHELVENIKTHTRLDYKNLVNMITQASLIDAMIVAGNYKNILVVTSIETSDLTNISAGDHLFPIVHKVNKSIGEIYVTTPRSSNSVYTKMYNAFDINSIQCDACFTLDDKSFKIRTNVKFDAVVLLGTISRLKGKSLNGKIVKKLFEPYCETTFDLIDVYRGNTRMLVGGKSTSQNFELMRSIIHDSRVHEDKRSYFEICNTTNQINHIIDHYRNLVDNLKLIESNLIYKVF